MPGAGPEGAAYSPSDNHLLAAIPAEDLKRIRPHLQLVRLNRGQVLYQPDREGHYLYFLISGVVSLLRIMADGRSGEIALVGNEGFIGVSLLLGGDHTLIRNIVQIAGWGYRIPQDIAMPEFQRGGALHKLLLRYIQGVMTQMAQNAVCYRHHKLEQRLCRWLLMSLDRVPGDEVHVTQELISHVLGVQRSVINEAVKRLQAAALIANGRGLIRVSDRAALEARACECYGVIKKELQRLGLLPQKSVEDSPQRAANVRSRPRADP